MLLRSCVQRCHLYVILAVPLEYALGMQFAMMHPHLQGHPGQDLWQREWQAELVREIVIAPQPAFYLQALLLQQTHIQARRYLSCSDGLTQG